MIIEINKIKNPKYGRDFHKYDFGFIHRSGIGETGIDKFMTTGINLLGSDASAMFRPNHMFLVLNDYQTLEADGHDMAKVRKRNISEYFSSTDYIHFKSLKPELKETLDVKLEDMDLGTKFDDWAIFYLGIEKILGLEKKLKHKPIPKLFGGSGIMCSNYFSKLLMKNPNFNGLFPFTDKHWSKISPHDFYISKDLFLQTNAI